MRENCGYVSPNNFKVFEHAVIRQGGKVFDDGSFHVGAEATSVPTCLPNEQELRVVGRLPSEGDTIIKYAGVDLNLSDHEVSAAQPWQSSEVLSAITAQNMVPRARRMIYREEFSEALFARDLQTNLSWPFLPYLTNVSIAQIFGNRFNAAMVDPQDHSRIAYEGFAVSNELMLAGIDSVTTRRGLETALAWVSANNADDIIQDVSLAIEADQEVPRFGEVPLWEPICENNPAFCNEEASGALLYLDSVDAEIFRVLNSSQRVKSNYGILANVPFLTAQRANPVAQVPLASPTTVPDGVTLSRSEEVPPSKLTLFLNVFDQVQENATHQCGEGEAINWGTVAFRHEFRKVALDAIEHKKSLDEKPNTTELMVLDGGFARLEAESFEGANWAMIPDRGHHAKATSITGISDSMFGKLEHGTAVTSLAMGGPGMMDLLGFDKLPIIVSSRQIYRETGRSGKSEYSLIASVPNVALNYGADIVNISFGTRDENEGRLNELRNELLNSASVLFVVAAGNLGNNDKNRGQPVRKAGLVPQMWGDKQYGGSRNMLVVAGTDAASDPKKLAWFSNYGEQAVTLTAPGCRIPAVKPTRDGTYVVEQFNGTSFSAPIVSYVAAAVRSALPRGRMSSPWIRARLLATADIDDALARSKVGFGRVLNPIDAMRIYDDVVTLRPSAPGGLHIRYVGEITKIAASDEFSTATLCEDGDANKHVLLRFFLGPEAPEDQLTGSVDIMGLNNLMDTYECTLKSLGALIIKTDSGQEVVPFEEISDIKFAFNRGIE